MALSKLQALRKKIHDIIFLADTPAGKAFDVGLIVLIIISIGLVMLESVPKIGAKYGSVFMTLEWIITILFTIEYLLRIWIAPKRWRYIFSFYGVIDLLSILPTYMILYLPAGKYLTVIRILRLLRVFRIFKLTQYLRGRDTILIALRSSKPKIVFFLTFVLLLVSVIGSLMYVVEGNHPESGFVSIPESIYWAIVTLTTVGYGDISPITPLGKFLASMVMILGYAIIAVPTGIVTNEMSKAHSVKAKTKVCANCKESEHISDAVYCRKCGEKL